MLKFQKTKRSCISTEDIAQLNLDKKHKHYRNLYVTVSEYDYLRSPPRVPPEQTGDHEQSEEQEAHAGHGPEGDLERGLRLPPELSGRGVGRGYVA